MKSLVLMFVSILGAAQITNAGWGFGNNQDPDIQVPVIYKNQYKVSGTFTVDGANEFIITESNSKVLTLRDGDPGQVEISKGNIFSGSRYIKIDSNGKTVRFKLPKKSVNGRNFISYSDESNTITSDVTIKQSEPRTIERWDTCSTSCGSDEVCSSIGDDRSCHDETRYCDGKEYNRHIIADQTEVFKFEVKTKKNVTLTLLTEPRTTEVIKSTTNLKWCR